jgi:hypothetical protein
LWLRVGQEADQHLTKVMEREVAVLAALELAQDCP